MNDDKTTPSPPQNPNGFTDPWSTLRKQDKTRTTIDVSSAARADISAVYPKKGVLQITINLLLEKLRNELKRAGLNSYAPEEFERAIAQCRICLGGRQYFIGRDGVPRLVDLATAPNVAADSPSGKSARRAPRGRKPGKSVETTG